MRNNIQIKGYYRNGKEFQAPNHCLNSFRTKAIQAGLQLSVWHD